MCWNRLLVVLALAALLGADPAVPMKPAKPEQAEDTEAQVSGSLLIQAALLQGRECLERGDYKTAVRVLEGQLAKANGDAGFLSLLEGAYRGYVRELQEKGNDALAQRYLRRLEILDPGAALDHKPPIAAAKEPTNAKPGVKPDATLKGSPGPVPGESANHEEPKESFNPKAQPLPGDEGLVLADRAFQAKKYVDAEGHYAKAFQTNRNLPSLAQERWAYCKLYAANEQMRNPPTGGPDYGQLESDVRTALSLAPRLDEYGQNLLKVIAERGRATPSKSQFAVQHHAQKVNGWQVAESPNFRVYHQQPAVAEQVLQVAEKTRLAAHRKWFEDRPPTDWVVKCDIYLHPTADAYSRATGAPPHSPGHSSIGADRNDASRIHSRQLDLHLDDANMLRAVLPHETTHAVLAGQFGRKPIPRWADEGLAVLSEPSDKIQKHLRSLPQAYQEGRTFTAGQLMQLDEYPKPHLIGSFYAQSASLVQYLAELRGPRTFTAFLRDAQKDGYEAALRQHYEIADLATLNQSWAQFAVTAPKSPGTGASNVAQGK